MITLLLTDVEGSTTAWQRHPEAMLALIEKHDSILIQAAQSHRGRDIQKRGEGDARFQVFDSPLDAVRAAIEAQINLANADWAPLPALRVRVAIHSGEVECSNDDYFGPPVNRCARMRGAGHGGQIILSQATRMLLGDGLPPGVTLKDLGSHRFKDLQDAEHIYQVVAPGLPDGFPPLKSLTPATNNLPVQLSSFIGRERQIEEIRRLQERHRLVTLVGPGGGGKTRLALQSGADQIESFEDGVWLASLVAVESPAQVPQSIAEALPISLKDRDPLAAIQEEYGSGRALLILDNCEHVLEAAARTVNAILLACPGMAILATSREPLGIRGEGVYRVPPMQCDLEGHIADYESVQALESAQLLRDRAASRLSGEDVLDERSAEVVARICKVLDGIPLALEQAAANLAYMSPAELLDRLEKHFSLLEIDEVGFDERHKTIEATIDWSYRMLAPEEQALFARLSLFPGGWTASSAEHICADGDLASKDVLKLIEKLVRRSLVVSERSQRLQTTRFRMLEPIRQYAIRKRTSSEEEDLHRRLFDWCRQLAHQAYEAGLESADGRYFQLLNDEADNIRSALRWQLSTPSSGSGPLELCVYMHRYWLKRGLLREGSFWLQKALDGQGASNELRAEGLNALGIFMWQRGELDPASLAFEESFAIWQEAGNEHKSAIITANLGGLAFMRNDYPEVVRAFTASSQVFRAYGDSPRLATALENLGVAESMLGHLDEAEAHLKEAVSLHRRHDHPDRLAKAMDSLLGIYALQGKLTENTDLLAECIELSLLRGQLDPFVDSNLLEISGKACHGLGNSPLAIRAWGAMQRTVEDSEIAVPPNQAGDRERFAATLKQAEGYRNYQVAFRKGWAEGALSILQEILHFLAVCDEKA